MAIVSLSGSNTDSPADGLCPPHPLWELWMGWDVLPTLKAALSREQHCHSPVGRCLGLLWHGDPLLILLF